MFDKKKIAIVYDWIDKWGGVERVLLTLHEIFPEADFYTSYYDPKRAHWAKDLTIRTSFIQNFPRFIRRNRIASFPFYPLAFESFNFDEYDLVISVTSSFAKSIITKPSTYHLCYLLTPTRYLWGQGDVYFGYGLRRFLLSPYLAKLRQWDYVAAQRPDRIISISKTVADRCKKYYKRESQVIYPPFDIQYWSDIISKINPEYSGQKFFLLVSRLEPYKRVDLVIDVFNKLRDHLVVVGEGSESRKLKAAAKNNVTFLAKRTDEELGYLYNNAEALIMPQEEDFGYTSLEAQFFGCPVIAFKKGGATETVVDEKTGIYFDRQDNLSLTKALERFHTISYNLKASTSKSGHRNVEKFGRDTFMKSFERIQSHL